MDKLFYLRTFGCQMNEHDSAKMTAVLNHQGFAETNDLTQAKLILFNTCTIRQKAHDKAFSEIGRTISLRGRSPKGDRPLIGVCGCVAQEEGSRLLNRFPEINLIFGPDQINQLPQLLAIVTSQKRPAIATELINSSTDYHFLDAVPALRLNGSTAYVTIMKGCNSHCSYCIVPKVRGTEVYRPLREILREIEFLVERGCQEVTLLGQNVNSYRWQNGEVIGFGQLIRKVAENTGISRIRFTSPHPKDVKEDLIEEYANNKKLCSHIHLPLQSGSDTVLRRMRRAYNTRTYLAKLEKLRAARPDIAITTDMIVGFPGETEAEFQQTLDLVKCIQFDNMFAFAYSPRPNTEAWKMADDVPTLVKQSRLQTLLQLQNEISSIRNNSYLGKTIEVLVESKDRRNSGKWQGRNPQNKPVNFAGQEGLIGAIVEIRVTKTSANALAGELIHG